MRFDETVAMRWRILPDRSPLLARTLGRSCADRFQNKEAAAAMPELEEAVSMGEKFLATDDANLKSFRESLARCKAVLAGGAEPAKPDAKPGGG